jgi:hypothetical protein
VGPVDERALGELVAVRPQGRLLAGDGKMVVFTGVALAALAVMVYLLGYPRVMPINDTWRLLVRFVGFPVLAAALGGVLHFVVKLISPAQGLEVHTGGLVIRTGNRSQALLWRHVAAIHVIPLFQGKGRRYRLELADGTIIKVARLRPNDYDAVADELVKQMSRNGRPVRWTAG